MTRDESICKHFEKYKEERGNLLRLDLKSVVGYFDVTLDPELGTGAGKALTKDLPVVSERRRAVVALLFALAMTWKNVAALNVWLVNAGHMRP